MRSTIVTALVVTGLAASGASPASAASPAGVADIGSASFTKAGTTITIPTQGHCALDGPSSTTAEPVSKTGITFGGGTSSCTTTGSTTKSTATGKNFELSALVSAGGPRVKLATFTVTCDGTQTQTSANWTFGGMSGITNPPSPVPVGYVSPIRKADGTALANAVFNTQDLPGDGSVGLTMLRIDFLPASGITGTVTLGKTSCSPTP
ncbi:MULTISPECIES: hypothetical protein [Amycolatopsis]|uniref:Secreted protein n=1 Tax=Amycolatopsis bullii TaxID=941987 RepID=A0ABQ3KEF6_9PSEU|nr:hypothetical protein [Amycolatopsis bullii]GHG15260.1 hypothetical protein GCM10017567_36580 [Amycolatopsis bullii]